MQIYAMHPIIVDIFLVLVALVVIAGTVAFSLLAFLPSATIRRLWSRYLGRENPVQPQPPDLP